MEQSKVFRNCSHQIKARNEGHTPTEEGQSTERGARLCGDNDFVTHANPR
jgi:hypothetical protein